MNEPLILSTRVEHRWRINNGKRVQYRFIVDNQDTILEEQLVGESGISDPRDQHLLDQGYEFKREGNSVIVTSIPKIIQDATKAIASEAPCWFEGCEELRRAFHLEIARLAAECPPCEQGKIIRKYTEKAKELLSKTNASGN